MIDWQESIYMITSGRQKSQGRFDWVISLLIYWARIWLSWSVWSPDWRQELGGWWLAEPGSSLRVDWNESQILMLTWDYRGGNIRDQGAKKQYESNYKAICETTTTDIWVLKEWKICNSAKPRRTLATHWNLCGSVAYQCCVSTGEKKAGSYL